VLLSTGGNLILQNGVFTNTGTGSVNIQGGTGGTVTITGARIVGGTLQGTAIPGEAFYCISNSVLQDVRIAGEARVPNGHLLYLDHGLEVAAGALYLDSTGAGTYLRTLSDTTLFGVMSVELSNSTANIIDAQTPGHTLTNNLPGGIRGSGQLGANSLIIVDNTYVYASGSNGLIIDPAGNTPFVNNGHVVALTGSSLLIQNGIFDNAGAGWIDVQPNAVCVFSGATVLGGNLNSAQPNGYFSAQSDSLLDSVTITPSAIIQTPNGHITYLSGAIDNRGTYILNSTGSGTWLRSIGNSSISGGGTISCSDSLNNIFDAQATGNVLTLQNQTLRGACQLGANSLAVVNNGSIIADASNTLLIDPPNAAGGFTNGAPGLLHALGPGSIYIQPGPFTTAAPCWSTPAAPSHATRTPGCRPAAWSCATG
jgi:hypothetical protein